MSTRFTVPVTGPFDIAHALQVLQVHSLGNQERLDPRHATVSRVLRFGPGRWHTRLTLRPAAVEVATEADEELMPELSRILTHWLGLAEPGAPALRRLASDPLLGPLARRHPGLRLVAYPDFFEALATTVLGQQISTRAARTLAARYTQALGEPHASGLMAFPDAAATAEVDAADLARIIGCPLSRAQTLQHVGAWYVREFPGLAANPRALRESLLGLRGIGPWSADYAQLRGLRDPGIFLSGDLVVRRALQRLGFAGRPADLDWGADNAIATVLLWRSASTAQ